MLYITPRAAERKPLPPECPADFDPAIFPIIACHFFGLGAPPDNKASAALIDDPPFHRVLR